MFDNTDLYDLVCRGGVDLAFLGMGQIDRRARVNSSVIGSFDRPKVRLPGQATIAKSITVAPGTTAELCALEGAGVIRAVRARVKSDQRYAWRKLVLQGTWDKAAWPQVLTPLGPFFGFDWDTAEYGSVTAGCRRHQASAQAAIGTPGGTSVRAISSTTCWGVLPRVVTMRMGMSVSLGVPNGR